MTETILKLLRTRLPARTPPVPPARSRGGQERDRRVGGRWLWTVAGVLAAALLLQAVPPAQGEVLNRIILRVNDRIATLQDYEMRRAQLLAELLQQQELSPQERDRRMEQLGERVYRDLHEELLLLSRADQMEIEITDRQLEAVMDQMQEDMGIPDRQSFISAVQQSGLGFEEFKEQWRRQLRMREVVTREVEIPIGEELEDEDLRAYYRNHREDFRVPPRLKLKEVVVLEDGELSDADERLTLARAIRQELEAGRPFEEVVAPHQEAGTTSGVIDLGWVESGELSADLEEAVFDLEAGAVSEPVPARGGLHVVKVEDREESKIRPFDQVAEYIRRLEHRRLRNDRLPEYMAELEDRSYIRAEPPSEARDFRQVAGSIAGRLPERSAPADEAADGDAAPEEAVPGDGALPDAGTAVDESPAVEDEEVLEELPEETAEGGTGVGDG